MAADKAVLAQISENEKKTQKTFEKNTLRKIWSAVKKAAIKKAKKKDPKAAEKLEKIFSKDLGPSLDKFDKEASKFPEMDTDKLKKHQVAAEDAIAEYVFDIRAQKLDRGIVNELVGILNEVTQELKKRVAFFESAGKGKAMDRK